MFVHPMWFTKHRWNHIPLCLTVLIVPVLLLVKIPWCIQSCLLSGAVAIHSHLCPKRETRTRADNHKIVPLGGVVFPFKTLNLPKSNPKIIFRGKPPDSDPRNIQMSYPHIWDPTITVLLWEGVHVEVMTYVEWWVTRYLLYEPLTACHVRTGDLHSSYLCLFWFVKSTLQRNAQRSLSMYVCLKLA